MTRKGLAIIENTTFYKPIIQQLYYMNLQATLTAICLCVKDKQTCNYMYIKLGPPWDIVTFSTENAY